MLNEMLRNRRDRPHSAIRSRTHHDRGSPPSGVHHAGESWSEARVDQERARQVCGTAIKKLAMPFRCDRH